MVSSGREGALKALAAYRKSGAWSDIFLRNLIEKEGLEKREAALATAICNGVLQNRLLLDFYLSCYCAVKLSKLEPLVLDILRLSAYQMLFLEKIPHSAAAVSYTHLDVYKRQSMRSENTGKIFVVSGPSGSGKSTILNRVFEKLDKR